MSENFAGDANWQPVKIGAGGWLTGMDIAPDGTMVARTDTYGAYIWNGAEWQQLITQQSMPQGFQSPGGVYEIKIAPSNSNILYMESGNGIYKSVDRGQNWSLTNLTVQLFDPNSSNRMDGGKMAIDPTNPNIVFAGTQHDGLWVTRDGGGSWQQIAVVPQGTKTGDTGLTGICISGSTVYVGTAGSGVYSSTDGGLSWKAIGGPADIAHATIASDGSYYATGLTDTALWKYANGSWTKLIDSGVHAVSIDPFNASHIVVTSDAGNIEESKNGGTTWTGWNWGKALDSNTDIPWLETSGLYMSTGAVLFDPLTPGKLWQSSGVGVWHTDLPGDLQWNTPVVWQSQSSGIEQLVANDIIAPAGGDPIFASWDRPFFDVADVNSFPSSYGGGGASGFSAGWSLDYASTNAQFLVGISDWWGVENSGFSADGGKTWQEFAGLPTWANSTVGGSIAASSPTNFIWVAAGNQAPAYTLDGGKTWANVQISGLSDWSHIDSAYYLDKTVITADRVQPNTFYLYDVGTGVYRTTDGGVNWTQVFTGRVSPWSYWNVKMEAVPGKAGELFFTAGPLDGDPSTPVSESFMHSTDGGATWQAVPSVLEVQTFGYGAAATPGGPATVYIVGYVNGHYGIWYSADDAQTWTEVGEHPMGSLDNIKTISGDMEQFGRVYVGFGGSGYAYLDVTGSGHPPSPPAITQVGAILGALDNVGPSHNVASGAAINDATPTLSGTLPAALTSDQSLVVYRDGERLGVVSLNGTSWQFTDSGASDGSHQYTVRVEDGAGNVGGYSAGFGLIIDTVAPNQLVNVTGASSGQSISALALGSTTAELVSGTVSGTLASGESLVVFRDGVQIGVGTVVNGTWTFNDSAPAGSHQYTAQVQDAAGNVGQISNPFVTPTSSSALLGTARADKLVGTSGSDVISGVPAIGKVGKGTIDVLTGNGGADVFVLGDTRGVFYDDGSSRSSGVRDYARITDFGADDKLQLKGVASDYLQGSLSLNNVSGTGIYYDTNHNHVLDSKDELIALLQNHGPVDLGGQLFV